MVLVIDDDPTVGRLVASLLRAGGESGATVRSALTLRDGLSRAAERRPMAVFLDLKLPDASELDAVRATRAALDRTPIIVLTADGDRELAVAALRQGADDFLLKSDMTPATVARVFRHAVERAGYHEEISRSERLAAEILDAMRSLVVVVDRSGRVLRANRAWRDASGGPLGRLCGGDAEAGLVEHLRSFGGSIGDRALAEVADRIEEALAGRAESAEGEFSVPTDAGPARVRVRTSACGDDGASGTGSGRALIVFDDVTSQRRTEEQLVLSDHRLALAIDAGRLGAWEWDLLGGSLRWNRRHEELWGYPAGGFGGTYDYFRTRVHPDDLAALEAAIGASMKGDGLYRHAFRVVRPDGTVRWTEGFGRFFFDGSGQAVRGAGVIRDATAERVAEAALLGSQRLAALGELAAGIAHDLGNLIALARSGIDRVRRNATDEEAFAAAIGDLALLTEQGAQLVESLLGFSRPESQSHERPVPLDLGATCVAFVGFLRRLLPRSLRLVVDAEQGAAWTAIQSVQLQQVLMNLILNARDALAATGEIRVRVVPGEVGAEHLLEVSDDGPGIPVDVRERIFEPFFSTATPGGSSDRGVKGFGLGLAIVRSIAQEAGGGAEVAAKAAGTGTLIRVRLPAVAAPYRAPAGVRERLTDGRTLVGLVERNAYVRSLVADGLRDAGMAVHEYEDCAALLEALAREGIVADAIVLGIDGAEEDPAVQVSALHRAGSRAPVLVIAGPGDSREAPPGAILLRKPLTVGGVRDAVRHAVDSTREESA